MMICACNSGHRAAVPRVPGGGRSNPITAQHYDRVTTPIFCVTGVTKWGGQQGRRAVGWEGVSGVARVNVARGGPLKCHSPPQHPSGRWMHGTQVDNVSTVSLATTPVEKNVWGTIVSPFPYCHPGRSAPRFLAPSYATGRGLSSSF